MKRALLIEAWVANHELPPPPWAKLSVLKNKNTSTNATIPQLPSQEDLHHWYRTTIAPWQ
jgi:hypothetical protein